MGFIQNLLSLRNRSSFIRLILFTSVILIFLQVFYASIRNGTRLWKSAEPRQTTPRLPDPILQSSSFESNLSLAGRYNHFPRRIWQTSKHGAMALNDEDKELLKTWIDLNPTWRYEAITSDTQLNYLSSSFADQSEIVGMFLGLRDPILRADMIRYLLLLKDGGVYSDSDTKALKPIEQWLPEQYRSTAKLVIGIEYDRRDGGYYADWTMELQFSTWTILASPGHPLMQAVIVRLMKGINRLIEEQNSDLANIVLSFSQVLETTGPAMFSREVFDYLSRHGHQYTNKNFTDLQNPIMIEDVLILPVTAFGCGQDHSGARGPEDPFAYVQHMFHGSWKADHSLAAERKLKEQEKKGKEEEDKKKIEEQQTQKQ